MMPLYDSTAEGEAPTVNRHRCPAPPTDGSTGAVHVQAECGGACSAGTSDHGSGAGTASTSWPHVSALELGALPTAAGCARTHAKLVLAEWGLSHLVADAQILVSELVTNALRASWSLEGNPPIVLRLLADDHRLIIEAWDQCVSSYDLRPRDDPDAEHGRGLTVVAALSKHWGVRPASFSFKVVWCELELRLDNAERQVVRNSRQR
jgi:anti-sigma regulatory factor (Ser/Thr protein kinase)